MKVFEPFAESFDYLLLFEENCGWGSSLQRFKSGDFDLKDRHGGGKKKIFEDFNWRHHLLKTRGKRKRNWLNHWEWPKKPFSNASSKPWEWFWSKEIGFRTSWSREMLNGVSLLVNSCFKDRILRDLYMALWPVTKNGSTTIIPSAENHEKCLDTAWLISISALMKKSRNGSICRSSQKTHRIV